jgi:hypothetical protein
MQRFELRIRREIAPVWAINLAIAWWNNKTPGKSALELGEIARRNNALIPELGL